MSYNRLSTIVRNLYPSRRYIRAKKDTEKWEEIFTRTERLEVTVQVALYFLTLLSTLVAGIFDTVLYYDQVHAC
jgi:hypothetical protein